MRAKAHNPKDKTLKTKFNSSQIKHKPKTQKSHQPDTKDIKLNTTPAQTFTTHSNPSMFKANQNVSS